MKEYSILNEIKRCRGKPDVSLKKINNNCFRMMCYESDKELSAYYFSCPIYRNLNKKLITLDFERKDNLFVFNGVNATIEIGKKCKISNKVGEIQVDGFNLSLIRKQMDQDMFGDFRNTLFINEDKENILIFPTYNGIAIQITTEKNEKVRKFKLFTDKKCVIWGNGRYAALMIEDRQPFVTINAMCIGGKGSRNFLPIYCYMQEEENGYSLILDLGHLVNLDCCKKTYIFTLDLYASKSIFDTTVESANPDMNNSYGSIAFIGESKFFGEQWLFTRIDAAQLLDLRYFSVKTAKLYVKKYGGGTSNVNIVRMDTPWCSFGNTWNTKAETGELVSQAKLEKSYLVADITKVIRKMLNQSGEPDSGVVLRPESTWNSTDAIIVATADNYFTPQILEIKLLIN